MVKTVAESNNMCVDNGCKRSIGKKKNTIFVLSNSGDSIIVKRRIVYAREKKKELSKKKKVFTHQP